MSDSTGVATLDEMLNGGLPESRATLVTGTPGSGKSTLAMQFLQAGLDAGEECLFVSTEQTLGELRDSFAPFAFDLDHEALTVTSIHARAGRTFESEEPELTVEQFGPEEALESGFSAPFTSERIRQLLERYASADRVVLDSVTGLEPMADDREVYRRGVLDLIQLFTAEFGATTLFTAELVGDAPRAESVETVSPANAVQYNTHGVLRLWREERQGDVRRFVDVLKMRGVDHDTRAHEVAFTDEGIAVVPRRRTTRTAAGAPERLSTGVPSFDALLGGGFPRGQGSLVEYDGQAAVSDLLFAATESALASGMSVALIPRVSTRRRGVDEQIGRGEVPFESADALMDADRLFVVDALGAWDGHRNVLDPRVEDAGLQYLFEQIRERHAGDGLFLLLNTEAKVHAVGEEAARRFRYWAPSQFLSDEDVLLDVHNPDLMESRMAEFYTDAATVGVETWLDESGLQYVRLKKGRGGDVGEVRLVEYLDDPPYLRLR